MQSSATVCTCFFFFFSSRRRHTRSLCDWSSDVCSSDLAGPITDEALALEPPPKVIWMQLSVRNDAAAERAEAKGVRVVMNRCPKIEYGRLSGEIGWQGINSRILSAKKPVLAGKGFQKLTIHRPGTM